eukprot:1418195-Rhodomonas_salina.1
MRKRERCVRKRASKGEVTYALCLECVRTTLLGVDEPAHLLHPRVLCVQYRLSCYDRRFNYSE